MDIWRKDSMKREDLRKIPQTLRDHTPQDKEWFKVKWEKAGMLLTKLNSRPGFEDQFNTFIYAGTAKLITVGMINFGYKYIIEIAGSYYDSEKDYERDRYFENHYGIKTYRIKAYNKFDFEKVKSEITQRRIDVGCNRVINEKFIICAHKSAVINEISKNITDESYKKVSYVGTILDPSYDKRRKNRGSSALTRIKSESGISIPTKVSTLRKKITQ